VTVVSSRERVLAYAFLTFFALAALFPIVGVVLLALNPRDAQVSGFSLPQEFHPHTFVEAWDIAQLSTYLRSSVIVSFFVVLGTTALSILAGYAFGTMRFRGQDWLFYLMLVGMILPFEAVIVPLYYDLRQVGLTNTYASLILPQIGVNVCFGTFWMRAYFRSVPRSMLEAAEVDGAGSFRTLVRVALPPGRPAVLTLVVLLFMWSWNEFLLPLVMVTDEALRTAPLGLAFFAGQHTTDRIGMAAAAVIVSAPVILVFVIFQRSFIRGMAAGAVKE
jgi:raffinose/stachyose/melibiose transport system permease protein